MALSMAIDLGVHVDGLKMHSADALETEVRRRLFWSCYVVSPSGTGSTDCARD